MKWIMSSFLALFALSVAIIYAPIIADYQLASSLNRDLLLQQMKETNRLMESDQTLLILSQSLKQTRTVKE